ncbi:4-amino-4-deoxy-L-arabinose transferase-like glycosyltransferase [Humitalea rosea]|uniref:4-amino-4-deoxy-L-arabinose transferase-like glycosyltransferase n=1 Tax=Humitalea rosea TaxID=990373 RepID=A0A2W7KQR9_9PROT|nr:glycosyltransferase family 39 protein [Humitalea rosea]PZW50930.1 4-amino-4-deoxy-L-arabinose transferase-like glycosyltransferase [Humitalea rosea]
MNPWGWALLALTAARLAATAVLPLAPDEAYYRIWSRALAWGYLDHPPMVAAWIRAGTLVFGDTAFGLRVMGPVGLGLASLALWDAGRRLFPERPEAGVWAAALFNTTLFVNAGAVLVTPDTPQMVFWCLSLWALARLHASQDGRWWLAVGGMAGLTLLSKYTAVLLGAGIVLWVVLAARHWLRDWRLWVGGLLAVAVFAPVIAWNAAHGWASFAKQGGRAGTEATHPGLRFVWELLGGQIGLATPLVFLLCVAGVAAFRRRPAGGLLAALVLPGAALFLWQSFGSRVQGNWPAILYPAACLAAAGCLGPGWDRWRRPAVGLGLTLVVLGFVQAAWGPLPLPRRQDPSLARLGGWPGFVAEVEAARRAGGYGFIAAEEYGLAGELAFLLPGVPVVAISDRWKFFDLAPPPAVTGLLVRSERRGEGPPLWPGAVPEGGVTRARNGIEAEAYRLYRVTPREGMPPAALLP